MRLSFGQEMRQVQKQILAPRMIQSMEILQLPLLALQERIEQEIQENEALEIVEEREDAPEGAEANIEPESTRTIEERELIVDERHDNADDFERLVNLDEEWPDTFEERTRPSSARIDQESDRQHDTMANMVSRPETLHDHLHDQLSFFDMRDDVRAMCDRIIYNLDPNGYLQGRLEDLLDPPGSIALGGDNTVNPLTQLAVAKEALAIVQKLDPAGVGARDLRECLLLQMQPEMHCYEEMKTLVTNHLEDLENNRMPAIQRKTGYTLEQIQEALGELRRLKPKPGAIYQSVHAPNVTPDLFIDQQEDGTYKIRLEDTSLPNLYISPYYRQLLMSGQADEKTREYIKRKINSAQWLIEAIEQRRSTLTKVAQAIIDHQVAFLTRGPESLEPLKMQQIADKVGVHVTTVSRAVDDKWIQTPRGIFPLKRFFVGGTVSADGEEVAWDTVRLKLQEVIDNENKASPLSDDELVEALATHGITVARRTITKYRKAMNIPSSRQRRDWSLEDTTKSRASANHGNGRTNHPVENNGHTDGAHLAAASLTGETHARHGHVVDYTAEDTDSDQADEYATAVLPTD
ncbi:MAG: RNA polymerase factor sigma-54 [Pirellulales bacterium]|nr:RNA polymerase factor sigma-54 [Pirellulales bacterium]